MTFDFCSVCLFIGLDRNYFFLLDTACARLCFCHFHTSSGIFSTLCTLVLIILYHFAGNMSSAFITFFSL